MKKRFFLCLFTIIFLLIFQAQANVLTPADEKTDSDLKVKNLKGVTVLFEPSDFSQEGLTAVNKLIDLLQSELNDLPRHFGTRNMRAIGDFYRDEGLVTKDTGETVQGVAQISSYFNELKKRQATDLSFRLVSIYVKEFKHLLVKAKDKDIVHVAYISISYSFRDNQGQLIDPPSGTTRKHMKVCEWD